MRDDVTVLDFTGDTPRDGVSRVGRRKCWGLRPSASTRLRNQACGTGADSAIGATEVIACASQGDYLDEFTFRFNNRKNEDIFGLAVSGC